MKCNNDCFNCIYDDCILTDSEAARSEKSDSTYKDPTPHNAKSKYRYEKYKEYHRQYSIRHYQENKEYYKEYMKQYELRKKAENPNYIAERGRIQYEKLKSDPVRWAEYQKKKKEYYQRRKEEKLNGTIV